MPSSILVHFRFLVTILEISLMCSNILDPFQTRTIILKLFMLHSCYRINFVYKAIQPIPLHRLPFIQHLLIWMLRPSKWKLCFLCLLHYFSKIANILKSLLLYLHYLAVNPYSQPNLAWTFYQYSKLTSINKMLRL